MKRKMDHTKPFRGRWPAVRKLSVILLFLLVSFLLKATRAEEVKFTVSAPPSISVGEQFRISFNVSAAGSDFRGPGFKGFSVVSGPSQSSSSSIQIINGAMTQTVTYSFVYVLQADKEGTFEVGPASINVQGRTYRTQPFQVRVVKGSARTQQGQGGQSGGGRGGQSSPQQPATISGNDLFVRTIVNKSEAYQGEQILVTQKIYARVSLVGFEDIKYPAYTGFWTSEVKMPEQINLKKETVDGVVYNVAELKKTILIPQKSGTLSIEPITVTAVVQVRVKGQRRTGDPFFDNFFNDPFFGSGVQNVQKDVRSAPVTIRVKPLPEQGRPDDFGGAVGSFSLKTSVDRESLKANEAINYKVIVSGNGNLELVDRLNIAFPSDFEVYDPKVTNNFSATPAGITGSRTFEYLVIPRNPGTFTIPSLSLSYFDLSGKTYKKTEAGGFTIRVAKGDGSNVAYSASGKEDIKYLGSDIRYIKTGQAMLNVMGSGFFLTGWFWILLALPPMFFTLILVIWRRRVRLLGDQKLLKNKRATRVAVSRLKKAGEHLKKREEAVFYVEVSQALWGYLSDKLSIPVSGLSAETAREAMLQHNVPETLSSQYLAALESCEFARFAPGLKEEKMDGIYREAMNVITATEKSIK